MEIVLLIKTPKENFAVTLDQILTVGRTGDSELALNDENLSRRHATFEVLNGEVWVFDEKSLNGTFVNGERVAAAGIRLRDGDEIFLGTNTSITAEIRQGVSGYQPPAPNSAPSAAPNSPEKRPKTPKSGEKKLPPPIPASAIENLPLIPLIAGGLFIFILASALIVILIIRNNQSIDKGDNSNDKNDPKTTQTAKVSAEIPVKVIDPFAGQEIETMEDLLSEWEVQDTLEAKDIDDIKVGDTEKTGTAASTELQVTREFWEKQHEIALQSRGSEPTGERPEGMILPPEFGGKGVAKQSAKLDEMMRNGYQQPMDFGDLAAKRVAGELVEMPLATNTYLLEVGSNAGEGDFMGFDFDRDSYPLEDNSPKKQAVFKVGTIFALDLTDGRNRKQVRMRLLRMFQPKARVVLLEIAQAYYNEFKRPLRVTSLTRSMDYQISLNKTNANSFKVRGKGSLPPHTSGCAFDLARKHMTAKEQNFVMNKLAEMERRNIIDAIIEYHANACFHVFIYPDGKPAGAK